MFLQRKPSFGLRRRSMWARLFAIIRRVIVNWASGLLNFRSRVSTLASRLFILNELLFWSFVLAAFEMGPMCFSYEVGFAGLVWLFLSVLVRSIYGRLYPSASPPGPKPCRDKKRYKRASKAKKKTAKAGAA
ncbi:hypothetical protein B0H16DRAFT_1532220 [Mycena metata]|uniref:Uncharacterized protein n=1 Tax=Mycena metata TaxID=1033252 RepID=A0AAD7JDS1_9AGAR|nr:hypothetical protein B0H16DRAFT_1532220 [Mycena metata]